MHTILDQINPFLILCITVSDILVPKRKNTILRQNVHYSVMGELNKLNGTANEMSNCFAYGHTIYSVIECILFTQRDIENENLIGFQATVNVVIET